VYRVTAPDFCAHDLFVCLDETVQPVTIDLLTMEKEDIFICLDSALSDELKARVQDKFNVHVI
jgi:adenine-specific DNA-methyltransferase